jgi:hypothetical protein
LNSEPIKPTIEHNNFYLLYILWQQLFEITFDNWNFSTFHPLGFG